MNTPRFVLLFALIASAGACSSPELFKDNRELLDRAQVALAAGEYSQTVALSDDLVANTEADAKTYRLQRFFAAYLAAEAHQRASFGGGFLEEPRHATELSLGRTEQSDGSSVAHMVAATRQASFGMDWAPASVGEKALATELPEELGALGVQNARLGLSLNILTVYARLGFDSKTSRILEDNVAMLELDGCEGLMDAAQVPPQSRPWVTYLVFRHLVERDEQTAFRFAARTLFPGSEHHVDPRIERELKDWILTDSTFQFSCPKDGAPANPTVPFCPLDNVTELVDFVAQRRPQ